MLTIRCWPQGFQNQKHTGSQVVEHVPLAEGRTGALLEGTSLLRILEAELRAFNIEWNQRKRRSIHIFQHLSPQ